MEQNEELKALGSVSAHIAILEAATGLNEIGVVEELHKIENALIRKEKLEKAIEICTKKRVDLYALILAL